MKKLSKVLFLFLMLSMAFAVVSCTPSTGDASSSSSKKKEDPKPTPTPKPTPKEPETSLSEGALTLEFLADGEITITNPWSTLKYTKNDGKLTAVEGSGDPVTANISVKKDDKISFYAEASENTNYDYMNINCSSDCYIYGNIMSLVTLEADSKNWNPSAKSLTAGYCFSHLFYNNSHIKNHEDKLLLLPATTVSYCCYSNLFRNCTSLKSAPALPSTTLVGGCYEFMFKDCTSLESTPELPATTIASFCYYYMFSGCTSLTTAPELPALRLEGYCYAFMFHRCQSLISAPVLPATSLNIYCYSCMFSGCTSLTAAPDLPATILEDNCYEGMFTSCKSLTSSPELPASKLAEYCYSNMFSGCTSLTSAPELPASKLADYCYSAMFYKCTAFTSAPILPATTLSSHCYDSMFLCCSNLNYIKCLATDISASGCTTNWVYEVSATGTFVKAAGVDWSTGENGIPEGWTVEGPELQMSEIPLTLDFVDDGIITIKNPWSTLKYSKNGGELTAVEAAGNPPTANISVNQNDKIHFYAEGSENTSSKTMKINCSSDCYIYGNIMSLVTLEADTSNWDSSATELTRDYCFYGLFDSNRHIKNHNKKSLLLPATTLTRSCYGSMFYGCTSLSYAPKLPATTLAYGCYSRMFIGCTSLTAVPDLSATSLSDCCYMEMFSNCRSLTSAQDRLPATSLSDYCYSGMFADCISLTSAPDLPATTLAKNCYSDMFSGCISLTSAPELSATTLADQCYYEMFLNCSSLTSAPDLPATTLAKECYLGMFSCCKALSAAPSLPATNLAESCYYSMFAICTSLSSAPKLPATTLAFGCYYSMFYGCTSLSSAPDLPATTLITYCYGRMFYGCTSLTSVPILPATNLAEYCYYQMFTDCSKLNYIKCLATDISATDCTYHWIEGTASSGTFVKAAGVDWSTGSSGIPNGWTVEDSLQATPLTLEFTADGIITITNPWSTLKYQRNNGALTPVETSSITVNENDKISFYAEGSENKGNQYIYMNINCSSDCYLYGNIMSLLTLERGTNNWDPSAVTLTTVGCFEELFYNNSHIKNHSEKALLLPATNLAEYCYASMFCGCTSLTSAPILPATNLAEYCYYQMFSMCSKLNYIKCLATNRSGFSTIGWTGKIAASGTFVKAAGVEWPTGANGIPSGWTVLEE